MSKQASVQQSVDMISEFLGPIRAQAQKEAEAASFSASTTQAVLGNEQTQAAKDSGSTAPDEKPNSAADGQQASDTQGPQTLASDEEVEAGNIGPVSEQEISQEQKMARASRLGNEILYQLEASLGKLATENSDDQDEVNETPTDVLPAAVPNDSDGAPEGGDKLAAEAHPVMQQLTKTASDAAQEFYEGYLTGMLKRAQDELEVESSVPAGVLEKAGGVQALLDKVAMDTPEAVLPEGVVIPQELPESDLEEGAAPIEDIEAGAVSEEDIEAIGAQLEEAGVTPEELQQAIEDVQALQEAGVSPEDLAAALSAEGEIPAEEAALDEVVAPEEAPAAALDAAPNAELGPEDKEASSQALAKINEILNR
jgi:hypothetical protein